MIKYFIFTYIKIPFMGVEQKPLNCIKNDFKHCLYMIIPGLSSVSSLQPHCTALSTWTSDASQLSQEHGTFSCSKPLIDGYLRKIRSICPISTTRTTSQPEPEHSVYRAVRRAGQQVALQEMSCSSSNRSFTVVLKGFQQWKPALLHKLLCHLQGISDIRLTQ